MSTCPKNINEVKQLFKDGLNSLETGHIVTGINMLSTVKHLLENQVADSNNSEWIGKITGIISHFASKDIVDTTDEFVPKESKHVFIDGEDIYIDYDGDMATIYNKFGNMLFKTKISAELMLDKNNKKTNKGIARVINRYTDYKIGIFSDPSRLDIDRGLQARLILTNAQNNPLSDNMNIDIKRIAVKKRNIPTIFTTNNTPFSSLIQSYFNSEESPDTFREKLDAIVAYMPDKVRKMLIGENIPGQEQSLKTKQFLDDIPGFFKLFYNVYIPSEIQDEQKYTISSDGTFALLTQRKFLSPNYMQLLGTIEYGTSIVKRKFYPKEIDSAIRELLPRFNKMSVALRKSFLGDEYNNIDLIEKMIAVSYEEKQKSTTGKTIDEIFFNKLQDYKNGTNVDFTPTAKKELREQEVTTEKLILDDNISEIIKFYTIKALADMQAVQTELLDMKDSDLIKALGIDPFSVDEIRARILAGSIPVSSFTKNAAKDAFKMMGLQINENINQDISFGIIATIEAQIRSALLSSNFVKEERYQGPNNGKHLLFFSLNDGTSGNSIVNENIESAIRSINKLQYINIDEVEKLPHDKPIEKVKPVMNGSKITTDTNIKEYMKKQQKIKWVYKEDFRSVYDKLSEIYAMDDLIAQRDALITFYTGYGYTDLRKVENFHFDDVKKYISKNREIEKSFDTLYNMYEDFKDNGFYLPMEQVVNYRVQYAGPMQPQLYKLIRSFIEQERQIDENGNYVSGHSYEMDVNEILDPNNPNTKMTKFALGQAFDMDPDKNSDTTILNEIDSIMNFTSNGIVFNTNTTLGSLLDDLINNETLNDSELALRQNELYNITEGHHGLQALRLLKRIDTALKSNDIKSFNNDLTLETDAITSGIVLTMMQVFDLNTIDLLAKGGVYTKKLLDKWTNYSKKMLIFQAAYQDAAEGKEIQSLTYYAKKISSNIGPAALIEAGNFHQKIIDNLNDKSTSLDTEEILDIVSAQLGSTFSSKSIINTEAFNDMYKTIGQGMRTKLADTLSSLENEKQNIEMFLNSNSKKNAVSEENKKHSERLQQINYSLSLALFVGKIDSKLLRSIAKSPTMEYNYGSMIESVKKKLAFSVGKENFKKAIAILQDKNNINTDEYNKAKDFVDNVLLEYINISNKNSKYKKTAEELLTFNRYNPDTEEIELITKNEISSMGEYEKLKYIVFDDNIMRALQVATDNVYGDGIEEAFKQMASIDRYRNQIKSIELITFELFRARLELKKQKIIEKNGVLTKSDIDNLIDDLNKNGYGHNAPSDIPEINKNENINALDMTKTDFDENTKQASFTFKVNPSDEKTKSYYVYLADKAHVPNPGAAPTTVAHMQDSKAITTAIDDQHLLSIYDAIVQSAYSALVNKTTSDYNRIIIEQNTNKDVRLDNFDKMIQMFNDATDEELQEIKNRIMGLSSYSEKHGISRNTNGEPTMVPLPKLETKTKKKNGKTIYENLIHYSKENRSQGIKVYKEINHGNKIEINETYFSQGKKTIMATIKKVIENDEMTVEIIYVKDRTGDGDLSNNNTKVTFKIVGQDAINQFNNNGYGEITNAHFSAYNNVVQDKTELAQPYKNIGGKIVFQDNNTMKTMLNGIEDSEQDNVSKGIDENNIFNNEGSRLGLQLLAIIDNLINAPIDSHKRNELLIKLSKVGLYSAHSAISDTSAINVKLNIDHLKRQSNRALQLSSNNIIKFLNNILSEQNKVISKFLIDNTSDIFQNTESIIRSQIRSERQRYYYLIGEEIDAFKRTNRYNQNHYQPGSLSFVNIDQTPTMETVSKLSHLFAPLKSVMKNAGDIAIPFDATGSDFSMIKELLSNIGLSESTNTILMLGSISRALGNVNAYSIKDYVRIINFIALENHIKSNGYVMIEHKNGIIYYSSMVRDIDFDIGSEFASQNNIYSKQDLYNFFKKEIMEC